MNSTKNFYLKTPDLGDSEEIELVKWYKKEGDEIQKEEEILELVTEKSAFPMESPFNGKLIKIFKNEGSFVTKEEILGILQLKSF